MVIIVLLWTGIAQAETKPYYDFSGGLNDKESPLMINDNEASDLQNIMFSIKGPITKRTGYTIFASTPVSTGFPITSIYDYEMEGGTSYLLASAGAVVSKWNTSSLDWDVLSSSMGSGTDDYYDYAVFQDTCVVVNGVDVPQKWIVGTGALADLDTGTDPNDWRPNYAELVEVWDNRLWFSGKMEEANGGVADAVVHNRVRFSSNYGTYKFEGADAWPPNYYIDFFEDTNITGMRPIKNRLAVFGLDNIFLIGGTDPTNYFKTKIMSDIGCVADRTIKTVENDLFFLSPTGHIYSFTGNEVILLSDKITTTINGLNKNVLDKACAEIYPKYHQYWLSVADGSSSTNNLILVFNYKLGAWSKYAGINAATLAQRKVSNVIYLYSGDAGNDSYLYLQDSGDNDNSSAINAYLETKYFGEGLPEYKKTFDALYVLADMSGDYNLKIKYNLDFDKISRSVNMSLYASGALWNTAIFGTDVFATESTTFEKIPINKTGRFIQVKFTNEYADQSFNIPGFSLEYHPLELR